MNIYHISYKREDELNNQVKREIIVEALTVDHAKDVLDMQLKRAKSKLIEITYISILEP